METKTAIVTKITENESYWVHKTYGKMFNHLIEFDNGDKGKYSGKSENCDAFVVGESAQYTMEVQQKGQYTNTYINPVKKKSGGNSGGGLGSFQRAAVLSDESFCLSYSKDILVASWMSTREDMKKPLSTTEMFNLAESMLKWIKDKRNPPVTSA